MKAPKTAQDSTVGTSTQHFSTEKHRIVLPRIGVFTSFLARHQAKVFVLMIPIFTVGIILMINAITDAQDILIEEHYQHLTDLADTIDHCLNTTFTQSESELNEVMQSKAAQSAESAYLATGDVSALQEVATDSLIHQASYNKGLIIRDGSRIIASTDTKSTSTLQLECESENKHALYRDSETDVLYFLLEVQSEQSTITYGILIDLQSLYTDAVVSSVRENYWVVFYDANTDLVVQNSTNKNLLETISTTTMESKALAQRNDGYTILFQAQKNSRIISDSYTYTTAQNTTLSSRIVALSSASTENKHFAIAVSVYDSALAEPTARQTLMITLASFIMAFSSSIMAFVLIHSDKRERELAHEIKQLERENELTERLLEQHDELAHHQKLETIGTLTAGVAHEFNNLLTPIMGNSLLILENTGNEDAAMPADQNAEVFDSALEIYDASCRAKTLVSQISRLSRRSPEERMTEVSATRLIDDTLSLCAASLPSNIQVTKNLQTTTTFLGDEAQLGHMLLNLCVNGIQAMEKTGGTLAIADWECEGYLYFSIEDDGPGIPPERLETVFEPFYTTKEAGKGTGLGLAIALRTATNHGGTIRAENKPEGGAKFTVSVRLSHSSNTEAADDE